jgi:hypothetical protein
MGHFHEQGLMLHSECSRCEDLPKGGNLKLFMDFIRFLEEFKISNNSKWSVVLRHHLKFDIALYQSPCQTRQTPGVKNWTKSLPESTRRMLGGVQRYVQSPLSPLVEFLT